MKQTIDTRNLRDLRGVGKSIEANLNGLGVQSVADLAKCEGLCLYEALQKQTGQRQDPCVLDTFRCAVAQARNTHLPVEQTNWWWWSRQRLQVASAKPSANPGAIPKARLY